MSELDWEEPPPVDVRVPLVRNWAGPAYEAWTRGCYPPRRGVTVVWGCLFVVPWALWQAFKFVIWAGGIVAILLANLVWTAVELVTYRSRRKRALLRVWQRYYADVNEVDPPPQAA
jgi:hypothetical protein